MLDDQGNDSKSLTFSSDQLFEQILECPPDLIINGFFSPFTTIHQKRFLAGMGVYLIKDYTLRKVSTFLSSLVLNLARKKRKRRRKKVKYSLNFPKTGERASFNSLSTTVVAAPITKQPPGMMKQ